ncbi:hypothetical protein ACW7EJ_09065, partial [Acinetobacter soli]
MRFSLFAVRRSASSSCFAGKRVGINLTSKDVIHSFWVPALSGKTDTNPGLDNEMWLHANEPGTF